MFISSHISIGRVSFQQIGIGPIIKCVPISTIGISFAWRESGGGWYLLKYKLLTQYQKTLFIGIMF